MGQKIGHQGTGGRPKGSKNKGTILMEQKAQNLGIDPFEVLLLFALGDWKRLGYKDEIIVKEFKEHSQWEYTIAPAVRAKAAAEACEYLYPKRKAVELSTTDEEAKGFKILLQDYQDKAKSSK